MTKPSPDLSPTLRERLAASPPHVSLKQAIRALIASLRAASRRPGAARHPLASRAAIDRILGARPEVSAEVLVELKHGLRDVLADADGTGGRAVSIADQLAALVPLPLDDHQACPVEVCHRPPQLDDALASRLVGADGPVPTAAEAAFAVHRLQGQVVGGYALNIRVALPTGRCLPAVPRSLRADRGRWGRTPPWLSHLDDLGRSSLTPRALAERMVKVWGDANTRVVDACCGCGGNTVAFALAGHTVRAFELVAERAELARRNARDQGVADRVTVRAGSIEVHLAAALRPDDLLFVDPPWVPDGHLRAASFRDLFAGLPVLADAVAAHPNVMLKLPRTFAVDSLPGGPERWLLRYELGSRSTGDAHVVRMITAVRRDSPSRPTSR